jgi:hypothetical protein
MLTPEHLVKSIFFYSQNRCINKIFYCNMRQISTLFNHLTRRDVQALLPSGKQNKTRPGGLVCNLMLLVALSLMSIAANGQNYCTQGIATNSNYTDITSFSLGSMTNVSGCGSQAPGSGSQSGRYSNWVGTNVDIPVLLPNNSYNWATIISDCNCSYCQYGYLFIWVDFNADGDWTDGGELVYSMSGSNGYPMSNTNAISGSFTTPSSFPTPGLSRVRVMFSSSNQPSNPCSNYTYGETEDYPVILVSNCSGTPNAGTAINKSGVLLCSGTPSLDLPTTAYAAGMEYQWQSRDAGSNGPWTNDGTVLTLPAYTTTNSINDDTEYRCIARCVSSNLSDTSNPVTVTVYGTKISPKTTSSLCTPPADKQLSIFAPTIPDTAFKEFFEGSTHQFTTSTVYGSWTHASSGWVFPYYGWSITPPGGGKFLVTSNDWGYYTTSNNATSTEFSTVGYTSLTLRFYHYLYYWSNNTAYVEISTNGGSSWQNLATYTSTVGSQNNFQLVTISLNSFLNQPNCKIRFRHQPYYPSMWAIDWISIVGTAPTPVYSWSASPATNAGLPSGAGTPSGANDTITIQPTANGSYTYTATVANTAGGCPLSKTVTINVGPKPTSVISGDATICNADSTALTVNMTGGSPYSLTYSDGTTPVTVNNITSNTAVINVAPSTTKTFKVIDVATNFCHADSAGMTDSAVVNVNPRPTSLLNNGSQTACDAATAYLPVTFTGSSPFNITFTDGSTTYTQNNIPVQNYQLPVTAQTGSYTYSILSLTDANGCAAQPNEMPGTSTVVSQVRPTASISGNPTLCSGSLGTVQVSFTGTAPYSLGYTDGGSFVYSVNNIYSNPYTLVVAPSNTTTYTLDHVTDANCTTLPVDLSGSSLVQVHQRPTASISGLGQTLCHGNQVNLSIAFTGAPPYSFGYSNGTSTNLVSGIFSSTYNFTVTPNETGTYIITGLNDAFCNAQLPDITGAVPITVRDPKAALSGNQVSCIGDNASLLVDFSGAGATPPYTFMYTDGSTNQVLTTSNDPYVLTVPTTNSTTFSLLSFNDANCPGDVSGSAVLTAQPDGGWKGMVSSDWQNPVNWCGVLPTATTEVVIPSTAPHMPVLSTGAGYCDTMTVMPGASVTVTTGANLNIYGNVDNHGTLNWNTGSINFWGSYVQYVSGFTAHNVFVYNDAGVVPTSDAEIVSLLALNGNVYLDSADLTIRQGATVIGDDYSSFVHTMGTGTLNMNVSNAPVRFPVGKSSYNPVTLTNYGVPDRFSVRVMDAVYKDGYGINPETVTFPVVNRTWMIDEATVGGSVVTIQPQWSAMAGEEINFFDREHSFVRHWNGTSWTYLDSIGAGPAQGIDPYYVSDGAFTDFSPYTVGGWGMYPLSIGLLSFEAELKGNNNALVSWKISESSEAQAFEVERSEDGANFTKIADVAAVVEQLNYNITDRELAAGRHYYRLKSIDRNGKSAYSKVAVVVAKGLGVEVISLSPNPVTGTGVVTLSSDEQAEAEIRIVDAVGRVLYTGTHSLRMGMNKLSLDMNQLAQGNYTLHVMTKEGKATPIKFSKL